MADPTPSADKAVALSCLQEHPRAHTYGVGGRRFRVVPGQRLVVDLEAFKAHLEPDAVFRREYHAKQIKVELVDAALAPAVAAAPVDHGPDALPPPPVLGVNRDDGIFLQDPARPTSEAELALAKANPEAAALAAVRGVGLQQFLDERAARAAAAPPLPPAPEGGESKGKGKKGHPPPTGVGG